MLKTTFQKIEPKELIYRDSKHFYFESLKNDLVENMFTCDRSYDQFDRRLTMVRNNWFSKRHAISNMLY